MSEEIPGYDQMSANFKALTYGLQRKVLMAATRDGAAVIVEAAEERAPRLTGNLAENMTSRIYESSPAEVTARIGPDKSTPYGRFPEFGTIHAKAEPYLRPALDEKHEEAMRVIGESLMDGIEKELRK